MLYFKLSLSLRYVQYSCIHFNLPIKLYQNNILVMFSGNRSLCFAYERYRRRHRETDKGQQRSQRLPIYSHYQNRRTTVLLVCQQRRHLIGRLCQEEGFYLRWYLSAESFSETGRLASDFSWRLDYAILWTSINKLSTIQIKLLLWSLTFRIRRHCWKSSWAVARRRPLLILHGIPARICRCSLLAFQMEAFTFTRSRRPRSVWWRHYHRGRTQPHVSYLSVVATQIGNWRGEINRFKTVLNR